MEAAGKLVHLQQDSGFEEFEFVPVTMNSADAILNPKPYNSTHLEGDAGSVGERGQAGLVLQRLLPLQIGHLEEGPARCGGLLKNIS